MPHLNRRRDPFRPSHSSIMSSFRVLLCGLTLLWLAPHWYGINATVVENSERITSGVSIESNVPRERNALIGGEKEGESLDVGFGTRPLASAKSEKFQYV